MLLGPCKYKSCDEPLICINDAKEGTRCINRADCRNHPHCPIACEYSKFNSVNGEDLRKQSLHGETTSSVLLKLFINGNERCHTTDTPGA